MLNKKFFLVAALLGATALSNNAQAASDDECGIWMCLPTGFPEGCAASHAAMMKRVSEFKSPLPAFSSCSADNSDDGYSFEYGMAAIIPPRQECTDWRDKGDGLVCSNYEQKPEQRIEGTACVEHHESGIKEPRGCVRTERYAHILIDGEQYGQSYTW
ncbi:hypothetical protein ACT3T8_15875 [Halomonas sp. AOP1-B1-8]|uniref:hypothetical protein n=1 Tax=Halomonas sp. AOP1-B1-8 TaxID=3457726 RepID=UPI003FDA085D